MDWNKRRREDYVVFPVSILSYWWRGQVFDFRAVIIGIINHAKKSNQINTLHKDAWQHLCSISKKWSKELPNDVYYDNNWTNGNQPLTSIAIEVLSNYASTLQHGNIDIKEDLGILAYLAIKSMIGESAYKHLSWDAIVSRMLGYKSGTYTKLSKDIHEATDWGRYCLGKRGKEALIRKLKNWKVSYIPNGKGFRTPAFSYKLSHKQLIKVLEKDGKQFIDMKSIHKEHIS